MKAVATQSKRPNIFVRRYKKMRKAYLYYIARDEFTIAVKKWFKDKGDETLRLDYPLDSSSVIVDLGGYMGDFAAEIHGRYGCTVYLFEPSKEFYDKCVERFKDNGKVHCFNFGLGDVDGSFVLSDDANGSSIMGGGATDSGETVTIRQYAKVVDELSIGNIDLIKINIEGAEYPLLRHVIDRGLVDNIGNLQVQFHDFVPEAKPQRDDIINRLQKTHKQDWCYPFVWENWSRKG